jgi:hypothetical protein
MTSLFDLTINHLISESGETIGMDPHERNKIQNHTYPETLAMQNAWVKPRPWPGERERRPSMQGWGAATVMISPSTTRLFVCEYVGCMFVVGVSVCEGRVREGFHILSVFLF